MEVVEITFQTQHERAALPIAACLATNKQAKGICSAASACADRRRIAS